MPINKTLAAALVKKYGKKKGESIYFGLENAKGKKGLAFRKGLKTAKKEGHVVAKFSKKKKRRSKE